MRLLPRRSGTITTPLVKELCALLGMRWDDGLAGIPDQVDSAIQFGRAAPLALADLISAITTDRPNAEVLALGLADVVLAQKLKWPKPVLLLLPETLRDLPNIEALEDAGLLSRHSMHDGAVAARVMGPTPPGIGVMPPATSAHSAKSHPGVWEIDGKRRNAGARFQINSPHLTPCASRYWYSKPPLLLFRSLLSGKTWKKACLKLTSRLSRAMMPALL